MSTTPNNGPDAPADSLGPSARTDAVSLQWADVDRQTWDIELTPAYILLRSGEKTVKLPETDWAKDLYAAKHGEGFIIRIETFDCAVRFMVDAQQAAPFFAHVNPPPQTPEREPDKVKPQPAQTKPLLWPKVSPIAVWALICSVPSFIPFWGWPFAGATVILLILHRTNVRRSDAWRHSRALCLAAFVFLIVGLFVSMLATWGIRQGFTEASVLYSAPTGGSGSGRNYGLIAGALFVVLASLSVHEAAHAITAWWLGDGLARSMGRVTLNPLSHIDPFGTVLLPLLLVWMGGPVFGYARPVPVRVESLPRHRRAHILISLAGPGSNMILAGASLMLLIALGCVIRLAVPEASLLHLGSPYIHTPVAASGFALAPAVGPLCTILKLSFFINVLLAMFNMIPIPPLDGSWVLEHLFPLSLGRLYAAIRPYGFIIFVALIYTNMFTYLLDLAFSVILPGFDLLSVATGF